MGVPVAAFSNNLTAVFVDDEEAILSSLKSLFRRQGYKLDFFNQASGALEFLKQSSADVVVSDLRMPGMTGVEFLNHVADVCPDAVRIMLSGYEDKAVVMNALSKGLAEHYIMKPWEDATLKDLFVQIKTRLEGVRKQHLERVLGDLNMLPSPPKLHQQVQAALARENNSIDTIVREIEQNPPIVAKILRVANSVYYAARKPVTSVRQAVIFIGTDYVSGLVTGVEAFQSIGGGREEGLVAIIEKLWEQAVGRATVAKWVALNTPGFEPPQLAYTSSLLQDIGLAVRCATDFERYQKSICICAADSLSLMQADRQAFGITHDEVGAALLAHWNFPEEIIQAVLQHHGKVGNNTLLRILQIAEVLWSGDESGPHDPDVIAETPSWKEKRAQYLEKTQPTATL
jgi:HD-like signal output (HDOD) protein